MAWAAIVCAAPELADSVTGVYVESLGFSSNLPNLAPARLACEYCATTHASTCCPNCGGPAPERK